VKSKIFLRDLVYLQFSKIDAFFSKDKASFMEDFFTFLCPGSL